MIHMPDSLVEKAKQEAIQDVAIYGDSLETIVIAEFINEANESDVRAFQWGRKAGREAFIKLQSWAIKHKRLIRTYPFTYIAE